MNLLFYPLPNNNLSSLPLEDKRRFDIDALRGIAIISVILNHADKTILPGGFVGVDIFFVISGYVITKKIFPEIEDETFSFSTFYTKRIKRLIPSLFLCLSFILILSIILSTK